MKLCLDRLTSISTQGAQLIPKLFRITYGGIREEYGMAHKFQLEYCYPTSKVHSPLLAGFAIHMNSTLNVCGLLILLD